MDMTDNEPQIKEALSLLDSNDNDHWTADGLPKIDVVSSLAEIKGLKRGDITKAAPTFTRENPSFEAPALAEGDTYEEDEDEIAKANAEAAASELPPAEEPLTTFGLTEVDIGDGLDESEAALVEAEAILAKANAEAAEAQGKVLAAQKVRDAIMEERAKNLHPHQNQLDIMEFLKVQQRIREDRFKRAQTVVSAPKAPIDQAMARKKGFGIARPSVPLKTGA
jgi:hypothetical protein